MRGDQGNEVARRDRLPQAPAASKIIRHWIGCHTKRTSDKAQQLPLQPGSDVFASRRAAGTRDASAAIRKGR